MIVFPLDNTQYKADALGAWCGTRTRGVFSDDGHYGVTANGDMTVTVSAGLAWLKADTYWGVSMYEDTAAVLDLGTSDGELARWAAICVQLDKNANTGGVVVKYGSYDTNPAMSSLPAPERDTNYDEIYVAAVLIRSGVTAIASSDITDLRLNETYCGLMRDGVTGIPTQTLYNQWNAWTQERQQDFDTWFDSVKDTLDSDAVGHLLALINEHKETTVVGVDGVHGIRYYADELQVHTDDGWIDVGGGKGIEPDACYDISIAVGDEKLTIAWKDPDDTIIEGVTLAEWEKTMLVRKVGSYPVSETDGTLVLTNTVRNQYSTGYIDNGLMNGTEYFYKLFPFSTQGAINMTPENNISGTPRAATIFGVSIDLTNSNPETAVTYTDDAVNMTPSSADWEQQPIFRDIKPCILRDGVVQYYLDPDDFTKKADGSASDLTGGFGDVMVEIPKIGLAINTSADGNTLTVRVTDVADADGFHYYAHTRQTEGDCEKLYIGAYAGYVSNGKLRSISGVKSTVSQTISNLRTYAQAGGDGYDQITFYAMTLIQALFLIRFKTRDSQAVIGYGLFGNEPEDRLPSGGTNSRGMFYGDTSGQTQIKCFGIEDLWGNLAFYADGIMLDSSYNILTAFANFNNTGSGYTNHGQISTSNLTGFIVTPRGDSETGFLPKTVGGSTTTYFTDRCDGTKPGTVVRYGGLSGAVTNGGIFGVNSPNAYTYVSAYMYGRLMYLKEAT
jgi:hypothetical protein